VELDLRDARFEELNMDCGWGFSFFLKVKIRRTWVEVGFDTIVGI